MNSPQAIKDWNACVKKAKKKFPNQGKFMLLKGPLLKEAMKCYCAMGY
jgi:hypothetical protein